MRFAISLPQHFADGSFDAERFAAYCRRAEELGFESGWTGEQIIGTMPHLDPLDTLTFAAATTHRLRLGVSSLVLPLYSPLHLAKRLASIDQLSKGRLDIGVTLGGRFRMFTGFAVDPTRLAGRFTESLELMKLMWTEPRVDFDGRFWSLKGAAMEPKPFQKPFPPIWFGASDPNAVRRAIRLGDGFLGAGSQSTAQFAEQAKVARAELAEVGRDSSTFVIGKRAYTAVDDDAGKARKRIAEELDRMYGYFGMRDLESEAVAGTPEECVAGLRAVIAAGAEFLLLNPLFDDAVQMERLAAEVVPHLA